MKVQLPSSDALWGDDQTLTDGLIRAADFVEAIHAENRLGKEARVCSIYSEKQGRRGAVDDYHIDSPRLSPR